MNKLTVEQLARYLSEEFERDEWGDIEPDWFKQIADGEVDDDEDDGRALGTVLSRVVKRINNE